MLSWRVAHSGHLEEEGKQRKETTSTLRVFLVFLVSLISFFRGLTNVCFLPKLILYGVIDTTRQILENRITSLTGVDCLHSLGFKLLFFRLLQMTPPLLTGKFCGVDLQPENQSW